MSRDALKKAVKQTPRYQWHELIREQARWSRKLTIATNKLEDVRQRMEVFTLAMICKDESNPVKPA